MTKTTFEPKRVLFEEEALTYPLGKTLWERFTVEKKEIRMIGSHNRITGLAGNTPVQKYHEAKQTLVVGVRKQLALASCRPSADYQLAFSTSCPGMCEYCYLQTTLGRQPVVRLYVNLDEILASATKLMNASKPKQTVFEGAATSDPLPIEQYSGALAKTILFFANEEFGRFRFVTKFTDIEPLLGLVHANRTEIRFSVNTEQVISRYEHGTPSLSARLLAAEKVLQAGYPTGFLVAPIFLESGWQEQYDGLFVFMSKQLPQGIRPSFELITHRFTARAKATIQAVYPVSALPLSEEERRFKYGQFGYGKYLYPQSLMEEARLFFSACIERYFPGAKLLYFV